MVKTIDGKWMESRKVNGITIACIFVARAKRVALPPARMNASTRFPHICHITQILSQLLTTDFQRLGL